MYIRFEVYYVDDLDDIKEEIEKWAIRYGVRYSSKTIKQYHRVGFDREEHFTLFGLTWDPTNIDRRPWLKYELIDIINERY